MKEKIAGVYKSKGFLGLTFAAINFFLVRIFGVRLINLNSPAANSVARRVFSKCSLKYSDDGYYYLDPMPTEQQLNDYYSSLYWEARNGKNYGTSLRDLVHYNLLKRYVPQELSEGKVFLNFGAGHGGISNLCWFDGMDIVNVEPSSLPQFYEERWRTHVSITDVADGTVDVVYGSHSLEHVQDIEKFKQEIKRVLKPNGLLFWEVPNADSPSDGAQKNKVDIPHTYYFTAEFFRRWFTDVLLCDGYEQSQEYDAVENWQDYQDSKGAVIRALGRIS